MFKSKPSSFQIGVQICYLGAPTANLQYCSLTYYALQSQDQGQRGPGPGVAFVVKSNFWGIPQGRQLCLHQHAKLKSLPQ